MKIIHTSDWHLGKIFHNRYLTDDQEYVLQQLIDIIKNEKPDILIISGDIYDRAIPPVEAIELLDETLSKILLDYNTKIMIIAGNHDSAERLSFGKQVYKNSNLYIYGKIDNLSEPLILEDKFGKVQFYPVPFHTASYVKSVYNLENNISYDTGFKTVIDDYTDKYPLINRNILVAHLFAVNGKSSESERSLSIGGAEQVNITDYNNFDYIALGHLHNKQIIKNENIRYSGSILKYSVNEKNKSIEIIELNEPGNIKYRQIELIPKFDVKVVEDYMENLVNYNKDKNYVMVKLKDKQRQFNAITKLRNIFPNIIGVDQTESVKTLQNQNQSVKEIKKLNLNQLFNDYINYKKYEVTETEKTELKNLFDEFSVEYKL